MAKYYRVNLKDKMGNIIYPNINNVTYFSSNGNMHFGYKQNAIYGVESDGTKYVMIGHNGANLWIGASATADTHHTGGTFISAGDKENISVSKLVNNTRTNYVILDEHNYGQYALKLTGGTVTGDVILSKGNLTVSKGNITLSAGTLKGTADKAVSDGDGKTIKSTYKKLDGSNCYTTINGGGDGKTQGYRVVLEQKVSAWGNYRMLLAVSSRHTGSGILSINLSLHDVITSFEGDIRYFGGITQYSDGRWLGYYNSSTGIFRLLWNYYDYTVTRITILEQAGFTSNIVNNGTWMTTLDAETLGSKITMKSNCASELSNAKGTINGHIYLTGITSATTSTTSAIVFGTSSNCYVAIRANTGKSLVIAPSLTDNALGVTFNAGNKSLESTTSGAMSLGRSDCKWNNVYANHTYSKFHGQLEKMSTFYNAGTQGISYYDADFAKVSTSASTNGWTGPSGAWYQVLHLDLSVDNYYNDLYFPVNSRECLYWRQRCSGGYYGFFSIPASGDKSVRNFRAGTKATWDSNYSGYVNGTVMFCW